MRHEQRRADCDYAEPAGDLPRVTVPDTVSAAVDRLNRNLGSGGDRRTIVLIGDPGAGKSRTIHEVLRGNPVLGNHYRAFECPSPCTVGAMGATLLKHLGHPVVRDSFRDHSLVERIEAAIPHSGVQVVLIDEAQHALNSASELKLAGNRDFWKRVTQGAEPFGLVLSGTPRVAEVICQDLQLTRRTIFVEARRLTDDDAGDVEGLIGSYADDTPIACEVTDDLALRVMHACSYAFGEVCKMIIAAIEDALLTECAVLTIANFASAYSADTDCAPALNPFVAPDWHRLPLPRAIAEPTAAGVVNKKRGGG